MGVFGREKYEERAAWEVCTYSYDVHGDEVTGTVYLLSDGRFAWTPRGSIAVLDLRQLREDAKYSRHGVRIPGPSLTLDDIADGLSSLVGVYETRAH
ncbi:MAG: hypothetical protein M3N47_08870 [Chloroflexota bacterium]|nr:hypothetical protein [Chloroflexota bacterium]